MATRTLSVFGRVFGRVLCLTPMLAAIGCGAGFDSPDWVKSLRVLGVQKDHPYAAPTVDPANPSQVDLTMLDYDGTHGTDAIQRLWFSGCDDLPGDQYFTCLAIMHGLWQFYTQYIEVHPDRTLQEGSSWSPADDPGFLTDDQVAALVAMLKPRISPEQARAYLKTYRIAMGERFTYPIPVDIIENHQPSSDPNIPAFGLSFIFFTLCAGHIDVAPNWQNVNLGETLQNATLGFPFVCLGNGPSTDAGAVVDNSGNALGPDDFVSGYTQLFVYGDGTANHNPVIDGVSFNNTEVASASTSPGADAGTDEGADAGTGTQPYCIDDGCVPLPSFDPCASGSGAPHVPACSSKCPSYRFSPTMTAGSNHDEDVFESRARGGSYVGEQMWVNYYTDRGTLKHAVTLLRDASQGSADDAALGWSADFSNQWTPPADAGPVNLWAVAHDTRGGTAWVRLQICVDP